MNSIPETCAAILLQAMRITAAGKWHVFVEYFGHTNEITARVEASATNYMAEGRLSAEFMNAYLDYPNAEEQLSAIQAELDKLEQAE